MKLSWVDIRSVGSAKDAIVQEAIHARVDGILAADPADLAKLPPTVKKVLFPQGQTLPESFGAADIVIVDPAKHGEPAELALAHPDVEFGRFVEIVDADDAGGRLPVGRAENVERAALPRPDQDPAGDRDRRRRRRRRARMITVAQDVEEAEIIFGVLEHGSDGVLMAPARSATPPRSRPPPQTGAPGPRPGRADGHRHHARRHGRAGLRGHLHATSARTRASWSARTPRA